MEIRTSESGKFILDIDENNCLHRVAHAEDPACMNWVEGTHRFGESVRPAGLGCKRSLECDGEGVTMHLSFVNTTDVEFFLRRGQAGIWLPFNDSYGQASVCMTNRCHAHVWCGEESSYIMGLRMGGKAPHLGLVLLQGSFSDYSIEREKKSNDRGDLLLHLSPCILPPGGTLTVSFRLFWHDGREDFFRQVSRVPGFIQIGAEQFTCFAGETIRITATVSEPIKQAEVFCGERPVPADISGCMLTVADPADETGERVYRFRVNGKRTLCRVYVSPAFETLLEARCRFIAQKQQYRDPHSRLDGAYLVYDNEEHCMVYERGTRDHNAARERICMGILMAQYLKLHPENAEARESLERYVAFHLREICDAEQGIVCNDVGYENSKLRLYNYPWTVRFFLDLFDLNGEKTYLTGAVRVMRKYYEQGGENFYAFTIPAFRLCEALQKNGMNAEREELLACYRRHAAVMIERANNYPAHEVSYEQSIVAPAAEFLMQAYRITGEEDYLLHAKEQMKTLFLFTGTQPDHRMHFCAIRHWDGFWFGKRRLYGDVFPHYWNVLSANAFREYGVLTGEKAFLEAADAAYRGQLCQFGEDGSATCAILTPLTLNGQPGDYRDPWANDQDWALVYYLDDMEQFGKKPSGKNTRG